MGLRRLDPSQLAKLSNLHRIRQGVELIRPQEFPFMLPKTAEYALRAVVWLAGEPERREAAGPLAARTKIPRRYLHKVLQAMVQGGLVDSQSGPGGGYALSVAPEAHHPRRG
jgi:hypothetical protein